MPKSKISCTSLATDMELQEPSLLQLTLILKCCRLHHTSSLLQSLVVLIPLLQQKMTVKRHGWFSYCTSRMDPIRLQPFLLSSGHWSSCTNTEPDSVFIQTFDVLFFIKHLMYFLCTNFDVVKVGVTSGSYRLCIAHDTLDSDPRSSYTEDCTPIISAGET